MEQLHLHHHRVVIELRHNVAAAKIQHFFRALKVQREYQSFLGKVRLIQRWIRKRFRQQNVFDVVERIRFAPIIQKYVRGYLAREKVAVAFHKFRMQRHLQEQEDLFSPQRARILETMQVALAYLFRKRKARRIEEEKRAEQARKEQIEEAKRQAARERRMRQRQAELRRQEE